MRINKAWKDITNDAWVHSRGLLVGAGGGIGEYQISYCLNNGEGTYLNGVVSAKLEFEPKEMSAAGIVFRADENWSLMMAQVIRTDESTFRLQLGTIKSGRLEAIVSLKEPFQNNSQCFELAVSFVSGEICATVTIGDREWSLKYTAPHIPFRGYTGVIKMYGCTVTVSEYKVRHLSARFPEPVEKKLQGRFKVFVCHSSADKDVVRKVLKALREKGITYWVDEEQVQWGDNVTQKIEEGLNDSEHVLVCLSRHLGKSNWCRAEYGAILNREFSGDHLRRVIPLKLDESSEIPALLYDKKRADFSKAHEFEELLTYLAGK